MYRFLVADDEPATLAKMHSIFSAVGEVEQAYDGTEAVGYFIRAMQAGKPFDLVALDIDMPKLAGTMALQRIRQYEASLAEGGKATKTKVVMMTSHKDRRYVEVAIKYGCNGYLVKPVKPMDVYTKLVQLGFTDLNIPEATERAEKAANPASAAAKASPGNGAPSSPSADHAAAKQTLKQAIVEKVKDLKSGELSLPSQPDVYLELKRLVAEGADMNIVADLLKSHPAITGKLIKLSNTARYRGVKDNKSLADAISRLGLEETVDQVCAIGTKDMCTDMDPKYQKYGEELWQDSLACAYACEILATTLNVKLEVDPFTMGLMHDVGKIGLLRIFEMLEKSGHFDAEVQWEDMQPVLSQYEGVLGAILLRQWSLPEEYQKVARYHGDESFSVKASEEMKVANLAIQISKVIFSAPGENSQEKLLEKFQKQFPQLKLEMIEAVIGKTQAAFAEGIKAMS